MRATSLSRTVEPSALARNITLPNCSTVDSWPLTTTVAAMPCPATLGKLPISPAETCTFCARMAAVTSAAERLKPSSLAGSIQMRMARSVPNNCTWPTPGKRCNSGTTLREAKSPSATGFQAGSSLDKMANSRKLLRDLSTRTPCCVTADGSRGVARASRFCTSTCASSGLVPG